jgi:hypothetical protein
MKRFKKKKLTLNLPKEEEKQKIQNFNFKKFKKNYKK